MLQECVGDVWDAWEKDVGSMLAITTNGFIKKDGTAVMGAGIAKQAVERWPRLPTAVGDLLTNAGNVPMPFYGLGIVTFPVKHKWMDDADPELIRKSASLIKSKWDTLPDLKDVKLHIPRPGCGNGKLSWPDTVKPIMEDVFKDDSRFYFWSYS